MVHIVTCVHMHSDVYNSNVMAWLHCWLSFSLAISDCLFTGSMIPPWLSSHYGALDLALIEGQMCDHGTYSVGASSVLLSSTFNTDSVQKVPVTPGKNLNIYN